MISPGMMTGVGMILGTAAYMSPEQARGKPVDQRADIWAFGCVFYEMLTGVRVFETGETVSDAVAAILTREPEWTALPPGVPAGIRTLLRRCLQKDPNRRVHHIADARLELDEAIAGHPAPPSNVVESGNPPALWRRALPWMVAGLTLLVALAALWTGPRTTASGPMSPVRRLELNLPPGVELFSASTRTVAISPDGERLAFVGGLSGTRQVYVRPLDKFEATPLRGSEGVTACFFSPDGRSIGLVTAAGILKTISLSDGLVETFTGDASFLYGAAWTASDQIVFVRGGALWQVPRAGGAAESLTTLGGEHNDTLHAWPAMLPGGKTMLFGAAAGDQWRIDALVLATGERRTVVDRGTLPLYAASGHLVFYRDGVLLAAPFDADRLQLTAPAVEVLANVPSSGTGVPLVDVSASGTLVYAPTSAVSRLVWVSRQGVEQPLNETLRSYATPRLSPDGTRVAVQAGDLWMQDLARATFTRLASRDAVTNGFPTWTADGRVLYRTPAGLKMHTTDGGGDGELIRGTSEFDYPGSVTGDGETLVFLRSSQKTSFDIYTLPLRDPAKVRPVVDTSAYEGGARLSPDGRWLIYISNESGRNEVYLRPFPGPERKWQVSTEGGTQAIWNPNGKEIFYRNGDKMIAVAMSAAPDVALSPPRLLFEQRFAFGAGITIANYDVSRDGQQFIMVKDESTAGRLNVVLNWFSDLERLAPAR
jgi:Tol biopolymer transport system component